MRATSVPVRVGPMRTDLGWKRFLAAGWIASVLIGAHAFNGWRHYIREVEQRAEDAVKAGEELARRRAAEERLRIARDLHDSLTHSISVIKVQSGVAAHLARKRGEEVPEALLAIQQASTDATRELRETLGVLRDQDVVVPALDRLDDLLDQHRGAGLGVSITREGPVWTLSSEVGRAAYRVIQESLTNVSRHAGRASASVIMTYEATRILLAITDDGAGCAEVVPGHGLTGMRERVTSLGGELTAGPIAGGGFEVRAEIPLTVTSRLEGAR